MLPPYYDPDMSVTKAYTLLKQQEGYENAEDVIDSWRVNIAYYPGDTCMYQDVKYTCIQAHTSQSDWTSDATPALWEAEQSSGGDIPEWVQPDSANGYMTGDKVVYEGVVYESLIENNVWSPAAYPAGWQAVE